MGACCCGDIRRSSNWEQPDVFIPHLQEHLRGSSQSSAGGVAAPTFSVGKRPKVSPVQKERKQMRRKGTFTSATVWLCIKVPALRICSPLTKGSICSRPRRRRPRAFPGLASEGPPGQSAVGTDTRRGGNGEDTLLRTLPANVLAAWPRSGNAAAAGGSGGQLPLSGDSVRDVSAELGSTQRLLHRPPG